MYKSKELDLPKWVTMRWDWLDNWYIHLLFYAASKKCWLCGNLKKGLIEMS